MESFDEEYAKEAGISKQDWQEGIDTFQKAVDTLNKECEDINTR